MLEENMNWLKNTPFLKKNGVFYCRLEGRRGFYADPYKTHSKKIVISVIIILISTLVTSCMVHRKVQLGYTPVAHSSLGSIKPVNISLEVIDQRPPAEEDMIGKGGRVIYVIENGTIASIETALKKDLERSGHHIVNPKDQDPHVVLKLNLIRFWAGDKEIGWGTAIEKYAELQAEVEVFKTGVKGAKFPVDVRRKLVFPLIGPGGIGMVASPAFAEFIEKVVTHPEFVSVMDSNK
jgi:hypothetical protein